MKDKLTRTGHKKAYYRFRSGVKGFGVAVLALLLFATPVLIAYDVAARETLAEETVQVSEEEPAPASVSSAE